MFVFREKERDVFLTFLRNLTSQILLLSFGTLLFTKTNNILAVVIGSLAILLFFEAAISNFSLFFENYIELTRMPQQEKKWEGIKKSCAENKGKMLCAFLRFSWKYSKGKLAKVLFIILICIVLTVMVVLFTITTVISSPLLKQLP